MRGFVGNIEELTEDNEDFRRVLYTGKYLQLVLMSLEPGEAIGEEVHEDRDQFFRVEEGMGEVLIDGAPHAVETRRRHRRSRGRPPQRPEHRQGTAQALYTVRPARASRRHGPSDEGGCDRGALRREDDGVARTRGPRGYRGLQPYGRPRNRYALCCRRPRSRHRDRTVRPACRPAEKRDADLRSPVGLSRHQRIAHAAGLERSAAVHSFEDPRVEQLVVVDEAAERQSVADQRAGGIARLLQQSAPLEQRVGRQRTPADLPPELESERTACGGRTTTKPTVGVPPW